MNILEQTKDICNECGNAFDHINEEAIEYRCPKCQSAFRIREADRMHATGKFIDYIERKRVNKIIRRGPPSIYG